MAPPFQLAYARAAADSAPSHWLTSAVSASRAKVALPGRRLKSPPRATRVVSIHDSKLSSAAGMIGKFISGIDESNQRVLGLVDSVSRTEQGTVLNLLSGARVPMTGVDEIVDPDVLFGEGGGEGDGEAGDEAGDGGEETP